MPVALGAAVATSAMAVIAITGNLLPGSAMITPRRATERRVARGRGRPWWGGEAGQSK